MALDECGIAVRLANRPLSMGFDESGCQPAALLLLKDQRSEATQLHFSTDTPGPPIVGIENIDEEYFENGSWTPRRRLNGDENSQGQALRLYASDVAHGRIYQVRLYRYR